MQLPFTGNASQVLLGNGTFSSAFFDEDWKVVGADMYTIPSGKEVEKDGIDLAEMSGLQMRKIEQVFLYLFKFNAAIKQLKKKIKETADANNALRKENKHLRNELADLKKRVKVLERRFEK